MRLIDKVFIQSDFYIDNEKLGRRFQVRTAADFRDKLEATPLRFVLDRSATGFCTDYAVRETRTVGACMDLLRLPAQRFWVEWMDGARIDALASAKAIFPDRAQVPGDARAGALIETAEDSRSGMIWLFSGGGADVDLCPLQVQFDLTQPMPSPRRQGLLSSFSVNSVEFPALDLINRHALMRVEPSWLDYARLASPSAGAFNAQMAALAGKVFFDFPLIATFALLYQAPGLLKAQGSELAKLNAARTRRGRPALLEHIVVSASLAHGAWDGSAGVGQGAARGVRLHHVRGHLVRRQGAVFWRSAHLRGDRALGVVKSRTVNVAR